MFTNLVDATGDATFGKEHMPATSIAEAFAAVNDAIARERERQGRLVCEDADVVGGLCVGVRML